MRTEAPASTRPTRSSASACPVTKVIAVRKVRTPRVCEGIPNQRKDANVYSVDVGMCWCGTDSSDAACHMHSHSGELVRILSHLILTTQPPAAPLELIFIGMQLFFYDFHRQCLRAALRQCVTRQIEPACPKMYVWLSSIS